MHLNLGGYFARQTNVLKFFLVVIDGVDPWRSGNVWGVEPFKLDIYQWEGGHHHPIIIVLRCARGEANDYDRASLLSLRRTVIIIVRRGGALSRRRELERSHDGVVGGPFLLVCE